MTDSDSDYEYDFDFEMSSCDSENEDDQDIKFSFNVVYPEDMMKLMMMSIKEVQDITQISSSTTIRLLMNHFKWDKETLMDKFYGEDFDKVCEEAKVSHHVNINNNNNLPLKRFCPSDASEIECDICCLSHAPEQMTRVECGHVYCNSCWGQYITTKIVDDGVSTFHCPGNCDTVLEDQEAFNLITHPAVKIKYQVLITNSFVECNKILKWCPSPGCHRAVQVQFVSPLPVTCHCGHVFCFTCTETWHEPVKCDMLKKWLKKCRDDSETLNWVKTNTKCCPACDTPIEKNGGCNHMVCRSEGCKAEFCWTCLKLWRDGPGYHQCNTYDEAKEANNARQRDLLAKYLFYYTRYSNHDQSLKFESQLLEKVENKMKEMQEQNMTWVEVQFLKWSLEVLKSCRHTLMFTYVFAFYLNKNNQKEIFEENQKDLEAATEQLSGYLENDIGDEDIKDIKQKVLNKKNYCESRMKVLLSHVKEGYEKNWWKFMD